LTFSEISSIIYIEKEKEVINMKLKKLVKILPAWETIRVWGDDVEIPVWEGLVEDIPTRLENKKLIKGEDGGLIDVRYGCSDCADHVAVFIEE
jgi:hypothetical protein